MPNEVSSCDEKPDIDEHNFEENYYTFEEQKCLQMVFETFHEIMLNYNNIFLEITQYAYYCPTSSLGENKFEEVRKHLSEFLYLHKDFFKFKAIVFKVNDLNISKKVRFYYLDDSSKLIDLNSYLKIFRKLKKLFRNEKTSLKHLKKKYSITLKVNYNRKSTLQALKNLFKEEALSEESMTKLSGDYFIGKKSLIKTNQKASYKNLLVYLKDYYLENQTTMKLILYIFCVTNAYARLLCEITKVDNNSNDYLLHVRKFKEVLKEFYEFAVAHKSIIEFKNVYILHSSKTKTKFAKVDFDYSKNGLNFLSFDSLYELSIKNCSWQKILNQYVLISSSFILNNQNLNKVVSSSINKSVNSFKELKKMCYDTFLDNTTQQNNQKFYSPYKRLTKALCKRSDAFYKGKVSCEYFNQLCSTYEGSTEENGEMLKCSICLDELKIGAEVCRLPCGHLNCKTCIEEWFDIKTKNSDEKSFQTSDEKNNDTSNDNSDVDLCSEASNDNLDSKVLDEVRAPGSEVPALDSEFPDSEFTESEKPDLEPPALEENNTTSGVYFNEYEVDDNEEQKTRNQCPTCKHICS